MDLNSRLEKIESAILQLAGLKQPVPVAESSYTLEDRELLALRETMTHEAWIKLHRRVASERSRRIGNKTLPSSRNLSVCQTYDQRMTQPQIKMEKENPMQSNTTPVRILNKEIQHVEYRNVPVVTLRQIDELHERPEGTARVTFNTHKSKMVEGEDYFMLPYEEWRNLNVCQTYVQNGGRKGHMVFLSESGYLLIVKPFSDERSWQVQRELIRCYFTVQAIKQMTISPMQAFDSISISKDRMIELLTAENALLKGTSVPKIRKSTPVERTKVVELYRQGVGPTEISRRLGLGIKGVEGYLRRLRRAGEL